MSKERLIAALPGLMDTHMAGLPQVEQVASWTRQNGEQIGNLITQFNGLVMGFNKLPDNFVSDMADASIAKRRLKGKPVPTINDIVRSCTDVPDRRLAMAMGFLGNDLRRGDTFHGQPLRFAIDLDKSPAAIVAGGMFRVFEDYVSTPLGLEPDQLTGALIDVLQKEPAKNPLKALALGKDELGWRPRPASVRIIGSA